MHCQLYKDNLIQDYVNGKLSWLSSVVDFGALGTCEKILVTKYCIETF